MSDFRFAEPSWALLLWGVVAAAALLLWLDHRAGSALSRFLSPRMQERLADRAPVARRRAAIALLSLSLAMGVVALMRPQWGLQVLATPRVGAEIMVCLDVSRSMLAEDVAPNRLERAKAEIRDLLSYLRGDSVGLIAFAGRASVLAPITPDFSFLRLVLDSAGPHSVSRGGTRLEEPIRKAVAGFATGATVSRSIILITDGEDHDSFPLEAAREAAERGVRILAIGFGDEAGSRVQVTDPKTGAKRTLRDADGREVVSRLDGGTLREIALATDGAYVPAGTGVLDLESIYRTHIAGLTRGQLDGQSRTVRNEAFQWAVLASLLLLLASVVVASGRSRARAASRARGVAGALLLPLLLATSGLPGPTPAALADDPPAATAPGADADEDDSADGPAGGDVGANDGAAHAPETGDDDEPEPEAPRLAYNRAVSLLEGGDLDEAARLFEDARSRAGMDGLLRRNATYDLGVLEVRRADAAMGDNAGEALAALERAAAWFRETVSLDEADADARHNLELVLHRSLVLADALARENESGLLDDIGALMEDQRNFLITLREAVQQQSSAAQAPTDPERDRRAYRDLAASQLALLSAAADVSERAGREQALIRARPAGQQTPEDSLQAVQLDGVLEAMHQARAQMGQARGRLRRMEGPSSYRAASTALTNLKRARDRLLDPVQVLDILLADAAELTRLTGMRVALDAGSEEIPPQRWLTAPLLADQAGQLRERVEELHLGLVTVLSQAEAAATSGQAQSLDGQQAALLERIRDAEPPIGDAAAALADARDRLDQAQVRDSLPPQYEALSKLATAREHFLDLPRLIELLHADEVRVAGIVSPKEEVDPAERAEFAGAAAELQRANTARVQRVERALTEAIDQLEQAEAAATATGEPPAAPAQGADPAAELQRLRLAETYLAAARGALGQAEARLDEIEAAAAERGAALPAEAWLPAEAAVAEAVERVLDLRRLFFSVLEHLQELARRQLELGDETEETAAMASAAPDEDHTGRAGPLAARQETLSRTAAPIAEALREQATSPIPEEARGQVPEDLPERLAEAAAHVEDAQASMDDAVAGLGINPAAFGDVRGRQGAALESLAAAIQLLSPPEQQQQQGEQGEEEEQDQQQGEGEQQDEQQQQQGGQAAGQGGEQPRQPEQTDPAQLLQGIRDREAERRENRDKARHQGYEPVEKDW